jgi:hypothetical protein
MVLLMSILDAFPTRPGLEEVRTAVEAMEVLDAGHLVLVTPDPAARAGFLTSLRMRLELNHRAVVIRATPRGLIAPDGSTVPAGDPEADPSATLPSRLAELAGPAKMLYVLWEDADGLLPRHAHALRRSLDACFAAAAEMEFCGPDTLMIQRHLLIGGPRLEDFAGGLMPGIPPLWHWLPGTISPAAADAGMPEVPQVALLPLRD